MGKRGPKPRPTRLKLLYGESRPSRINANEPKPRLPGSPPRAPAHLSDEAKRLWRRLASDMWRRGLLTEWDVPAFEVACMAYGEMQRAYELIRPSLMMRGAHGSDIKKNPAWQIWRDATERFMAAAAQFGMTPSARTGIELPEAGDDELARLLS